MPYCKSLNSSYVWGLSACSILYLMCCARSAISFGSGSSTKTFFKNNLLVESYHLSLSKQLVGKKKKKKRCNTLTSETRVDASEWCITRDSCWLEDMVRVRRRNPECMFQFHLLLIWPLVPMVLVRLFLLRLDKFFQCSLSNALRKISLT